MTTLVRWLELAVNVAFAVALVILACFAVGWFAGWVAVGFCSVARC